MPDNSEAENVQSGPHKVVKKLDNYLVSECMLWMHAGVTRHTVVINTMGHASVPPGPNRKNPL